MARLATAPVVDRERHRLAEPDEAAQLQEFAVRHAPKATSAAKMSASTKENGLREKPEPC